MRPEAPTQTDPVAALASRVIGGPVGRYARVSERGWLSAAAVLSALGSMVIALGVLQKNHCVRSGWATPGSLWRMCYSDLPAAGNGAAPSSLYDAAGPGTNQPFLTGMLTWVVQLITPEGSSPLGRQQWFFALAAVVIALLIAAAVCAVAWMLPSRPWRAAHVALSPVLVTSALVSFDVFGMALMAAGLAAWTRRHPVAAGALLGAATMARSFPILILAAIVLVGWRDGRTVAVRQALAGAVAVIAACLVMGYVMGGDPLSPYRLWSNQGAAYGSLWKVVEIGGLRLSPAALTVIAVLGWVVALAVGALLVLGRAALPVVPVAMVMLVVVVLTGKSHPVQAAVWVLPLIAASWVAWTDHLVWATAELAAFAATWLYVGSGFDADSSLPGPGYAVFAMARLVALAWLAWRMIETAHGREPDDQPLPAPPVTLGALATVSPIRRRAADDDAGLGDVD